MQRPCSRCSSRRATATRRRRTPRPRRARRRRRPRRRLPPATSTSGVHRHHRGVHADHERGDHQHRRRHDHHHRRVVPAGPAGDAFYQPPDPIPGSSQRRPDLGHRAARGGQRGDDAGRCCTAARTCRASRSPSAASSSPRSAQHRATRCSPGPTAPPVSATSAPSASCSARGGPAEKLLASIAIAQGWTFVATDYEGLGTPGEHPYLVGLSEARGVLDIVRAAKQLPTTGRHRRLAGADLRALPGRRLGPVRRRAGGDVGTRAGRGRHGGRGARRRPRHDRSRRSGATRSIANPFAGTSSTASRPATPTSRSTPWPTPTARQHSGRGGHRVRRRARRSAHRGSGSARRTRWTTRHGRRRSTPTPPATSCPRRRC